VKTRNPFATMITNNLIITTMKTVKLIKSMILCTVLLGLTALASAQEVSKVYETDPFSGINVSSIYKVELVQGENNFVEITSDEKSLEKVEVKVKNGVLYLDFKGTARNTKLTATVVSPLMNSVTLSGASSLTGEGVFESPEMEIDLSGATSATLQVETQTLETNLSGASNLRISGLAENHEVNTSGASHLRAGDLVTQNADVKTSGASSAKVNVKNLLKANASGTSGISFDEDPLSLEVKTSGVASVKGASGQSAMAAMSSMDTTRLRVGSRDVLIIEDQETERTTSKKNKRKSFRDNWSGFEMGINGYMAPDYKISLPEESELIDLRYEKSFVYNLNLFQQNFNLIQNNLALVTGIGFTFNNYRFDNQTRIMQDREGVYFVEDEDNKIVKNKINVNYVNIPLMLEYQTSGRREVQKFHVAGGVIMGARIGTNARYEYDDNGKKRKEKDYKDFHIHPFKFDLTGRIGWGRVNLFATYSLNTLFKEGKGPELYPFALGIRLVSF
jgi:hypothetical protein